MLSIKSITLKPKSGASSKPNFYHRPRIYIGPDGETVMENLVKGRHTRPYTLYKKEVLPLLFRKLGLDASSIKAGWSQKAGCSCPCSPGFIVKTGDIPFDIHVTVTDKYVNHIKISGTL